MTLIRKLGDYSRRFWRFVGTPFRAVVNLSARQVQSLVTVGFLAGMVSLSFENWMITFYLDGIIMDESIANEELESFMAFLTERMRNTSILQGLITVTLGAVVLGANYMRFKMAGLEASVGRGGEG